LGKELYFTRGKMMKRPSCFTFRRCLFHG